MQYSGNRLREHQFVEQQFEQLTKQFTNCFFELFRRLTLVALNHDLLRL